LFRDSQVGGSGLGYLYRLAAAAGWSSLPFLAFIRNLSLSWVAMRIRWSGRDGTDPGWPHSETATLHVFNGGQVEPLAAARDFGPVISPIPVAGAAVSFVRLQCGHRVGHVR